jgi:hypothetical protein
MHTKNADGTLVDLSGNSNHGTINGAVRSSGYFRDGMRFIDNNEQITLGTDTSLDVENENFILSVLVQPVTTSDSLSSVAGKLKYTSNEYGIRWALNKFIAHFRGVGAAYNAIPSDILPVGKLYYVTMYRLNDNFGLSVNGIDTGTQNTCGVDTDLTSEPFKIGNVYNSSKYGFDGNILLCKLSVDNFVIHNEINNFNSLANIPLYQFDFSKHPSNTTVYDDFLPYSSARIASGSFKVNDDKLECVTDGQIVFRNAHEFDGDEYIKLTIDDTVYSGTGTITQGTTTASIEQGSTLITVDMVAGDTIDSIDIQFREPVDE